MKYYSEQTKKLYDSQEELNNAEKAFEEKKAVELKKKEERATRAKEVEDAYDKYVELLDKFIKDYGYYVDYKKTSRNDLAALFNALFNLPF